MKIIKYKNTFPAIPREVRYVRGVLVDHGRFYILSSNERDDAMLFDDYTAQFLVSYMEDSGYLMPVAEVS